MLLESSTVFCPVIAHIIYCCFKLRRQGFVNRVNSFNSCSKTLFNFVDRICLLRFTYMGFCGILFRSSFVDIANSLCFFDYLTSIFKCTIKWTLSRCSLSRKAATQCFQLSLSSSQIRTQIS